MHPVFRKTALIVCFTVAGTYAIVTLQGPHGLAALKAKHEQIVALQQENATLSAENRRLAVSVDKLNRDRAAQQLKIRERLLLLRPNETQFMLPDQKPATPTESAPAKAE